MNIDQLEAFLYVSITGNFSKAGDILYISQPTVSARIKSLEKEIGFPLFRRNEKNVVLTSEGEIFLPYARTVLENIQTGVQAIQQRSLKTEGELSIGSVLIIAHSILPSIIKDFYQTYPNINLTVHTGHTNNILDMVLNYEVPIGIARSVNHPKINTVHLFDDEMVLAVYPSHPFSLREKVSLQEVANEPLILFNRGTLDWTLINSAFHNLKLKSNVVLETDNIELVKRMVLKQIGIGILPKSSIEDDLKINNLSVVEISNLHQLNRPYQLIFLKETRLEGILKIFVDFIIDRLAKST